MLIKSFFNFRKVTRLTSYTFFLFSIALFLALSILAQGDNEPDAVAIFNQAQEKHEKGDLAGAISLYEKALKIIPEFPEAEYQKGTALLALGKSNDAIHSFRRAVEIRKDWTLAITALASALVDGGDFDEAEPMLSQVIGLEPQNSIALTAMTELKLRKKAANSEINELLLKVSALTSKANPSANLWSAKAALEMALGKNEAAKLSLESALRISPTSRPALLQLANLSLLVGDADRAAEIAARLEQGDSNEELALLKANILYSQGKGVDGVKILDGLKNPSQRAVELRTKLFNETTANGADLEKQLEKDSRNITVLRRLCSIYRVAEPLKAADFCRRAYEVEPGNINHAVGFGAALVQARQFDQAVTVLRKILTIFPENSTVHANLGTALFQLKRFAEAKVEFEWLTDRQPNSAAAYYFLGISHDELGEYLDSRASYQQYLKLADPVKNKLEIEKINLRLPILERQIKEGKGKKS